MTDIEALKRVREALGAFVLAHEKGAPHGSLLDEEYQQAKAALAELDSIIDNFKRLQSPSALNVSATHEQAAQGDVERVAHALQRAITAHPVVLELAYGASAEIYKQLAEAAIAALTPSEQPNLSLVGVQGKEAGVGLPKQPGDLVEKLRAEINPNDSEVQPGSRGHMWNRAMCRAITIVKAHYKPVAVDAVLLARDKLAMIRSCIDMYMSENTTHGLIERVDYIDDLLKLSALRATPQPGAEVLRKYVQHKPNCKVMRQFPATCGCGLDDILAALTPEEASHGG